MTNQPSTTAQQIIYGAQENAAPSEPAAKPDPVVEKLYEESPLHAAERQALADHHDTLTGTLNLDRATREALVREVGDAVRSSGIGIYDHGLFKNLAAGIVAAEVAAVRGVDQDEAGDAAAYEELVRELRGTYGDDVAEDLLRRVNRWLDSQSKLKDALRRARAGNNPAVVRGLVEHVRAENLGRA